MASLLQNIRQQSHWLVKAFHADALRLDYSLSSGKDLDLFFERNSTDGQAQPAGRLASNTGAVLFSIGAYLGETLIRLAPGAKWEWDEADPEAEINAAIRFTNGTVCWPMQRAIQRFQLGNEANLYDYLFAILSETAPGALTKRPWWKF